MSLSAVTWKEAASLSRCLRRLNEAIAMDKQDDICNYCHGIQFTWWKDDLGERRKSIHRCGWEKEDL